MSAIRFHLGPEETFEVAGPERAQFEGLAATAAWLLLAPYASDQPGSPSPLRERLPNACYVRQAQGAEFTEQLRTWLHVGDGGLLVAGRERDNFDLKLNTLARQGEVAALVARLHGQCELHCWWAPADRPALGALIDQGLREGLLREGMGWSEIRVRLARPSDEPCVLDFSVSASFPSSWLIEQEGVASFADDGRDGDSYYDLPPAERWQLGLQALAARDARLGAAGIPGFRVQPGVDYHFGHGRGAQDLVAELLAEAERERSLHEPEPLGPRQRLSALADPQ